MPFLKPLISYSFFEELMDFVENYWKKTKFFSPGYYFIFPRLNQSLKWRLDFVFIVKNKQQNRKWKTFYIDFLKI